MQSVRALLVCLAALGAVAPTDAETVAVRGVVVDASGAAIAGAQVGLEGGLSVSTDLQGRFELPASAGGVLRLRVSAPRFATAWRLVRREEVSAELRIELSAGAAERVTVTATRTAASLAESPASVAVLAAEDLRATAAPALDEALRQVPGFSLFRRSGSRTANPTAQGASLRGIGASGASRAVVLDDGIPLNDPFGGWVYWGRVPRAAVDRIEVVRGGTSDLYGSTALSGTLNVLRRDGDVPRLHVETSAGSQATGEGSAMGAVGWGGWRATLAAERLTTDGYVAVDRRERGAVDRASDSRHTTGDLTLERGWGEGSRAFVRGSYYQEARNNGTPLQTNDTLSRQLAAGAERHGLWVRAYAGWQTYHQTFTALAADRNSERLTRAQAVPADGHGLLGQWAHAVGARQVFVAGVDLREVSGSSDEDVFAANGTVSRAAGAGRQRTAAVFVEDLATLTRRLSLGLGVRADTWRNVDGRLTQSGRVTELPDRRETAVSPRLTALYKATRRVSVSAAAYGAFRAPTLNELYRTFRVGNVVTLANDQPSAERVRGAEAGLRIQGDRSWARLTGFLARVRDPIANVTLASAADQITRQRQNLGRTRADGIEVEAATAVGERFRLSAGYLWVDSRVVSFPADRRLEGARVPQVARHQGTVQVRYAAPARITATLQARLNSAQFEDDQNLLPLAGFAVADTVVFRSVVRGLEAFIAVENLTDTRFEIGRTPVRSLGPPRAVRVGLRFDRSR
jgi:outer membrane receptor protein involved in Fe transport